MIVKTLHKYVRTRHIKGSRFQHGDHDLEAADWSELAGKHLVIEEKVDGSQVGISFDEQGSLYIQSRGHYLRGGPRERQYDLLKQWASSKQEQLFAALGNRYVMYGEWLYCKHTYFYDALPHYFMEFDVLDTETNRYLSTPARRLLLAQCPVVSVPVIHEGTVDSVSSLAKMITRSNFITDQREEYLKACACALNLNFEEVRSQTDMSPHMEGLYVKVEDDKHVVGRFKYVRQSFTNSIIDQNQHWHDRPIVANKLIDGALERMFDV